jgi:hypothetical protein
VVIMVRSPFGLTYRDRLGVTPRASSTSTHAYGHTRAAPARSELVSAVPKNDQ